MRTKTTLTTLLVSISLTIGALPQKPGVMTFAPAGFSIFSLPQSLGVPANSPGQENAAVVSPNGLSLYIAANRTGTIGSVDLWVSQRPSLTSAWGEPQNLGPTINTAGVDNMPTLSPDGRTMFFNSSGRPDTQGFADIYMTTRTDPNNDLGWAEPVNLGPVINTADNEVGAGYFEDPMTGAATLYFSSDRSGDEEIYQSTRNPNGTFNTPTPVASLNSPWIDRRPQIRGDGLEIFFASDRVGGQGGMDIWTSTRASVSSPWNPPVNLAGANSAGNDQHPSLSPNGSVLYFASTRDGNLDLYTATRVSVNRSPTADFDGDSRSDISVFRPSDGTWHILQSGTNTYSVQAFGLNGDTIVPGDYDGDGRTDTAVFRSSTGNWYIRRSSDGSVSITPWGLSTDWPVPADYDGDGRTDIAVYRDGVWYIIQSSSGGIAYQHFGLSTDIPIAAGVQ